MGFSYADFGETIETTEDAAKNVYAFLTIFFETFSQFKGRTLHLAGESYGVCASVINVSMMQLTTPCFPGALSARICKLCRRSESYRETRRPRHAQPREHTDWQWRCRLLEVRVELPLLQLPISLINNGLPRFRIYRGRYEMECGTAALPVPFQTIGNCVRMKTAVSACLIS